MTTLARRVPAAAIALGLALAAVVVIAPPAHAAAQTYTVDSLTDDGVGNTLREAVVLANANTGGIDTIDFTVNGAVVLDNGPIVITDGVTFTGNSFGTTVTRSVSQDLFIVDIAPAILVADRYVTFTDVDFDGASPLTGRAIQVLDTNVLDNLDLLRCDLDDFDGALEGGAVNVAALTGSANFLITHFTNNNNPTVQAGALFVSGAAGGVFMSGSSFVDNTAANGGALVVSASGPVTFVNSTVTGNVTNNAGGAAYLSGNTSVSIYESNFSHNDSTNNRAGAAYIGSTSSGVFIENATFEDNTADIDGGALSIVSAGEVNITTSTFTDNAADAHGGAINFFDAGIISIDDSTFELNGGSAGGALYFEGVNDPVDVENTLFDSNATLGNGGAIHFPLVDESVVIGQTTFIGNVATNGPGGASGGAIWATEITGVGSLVVDSSTFSEQFVDGGTFGNGGGSSVAVDTLRAGSTLRIVDSTFDEDNQGSPGVVFAIETVAGSTLAVRNSTFVAGGGIRVGDNGGTTTVQNSIMEGDRFNIGSLPFRVDLGTPIAVRYSLVSSALTASFTNGGGNQLSVVNMQLGALANNGGPTLTMLPLAGSPAINAGDPAFVAPPTLDQRGTGFARVFSGRIDIGALELQTLALAATGLEVSPVLPLGAGALLMLGLAALLVARRRTV